MHMRHLRDTTDPPFFEVMLLPFSMTQDQLTEALPATLPTEVLTQLCSSLQPRNFIDLWNGPLAVFAKQHCLLCHGAIAAPDLLLHLQEAHSLVHHGAAPLIHAMHTAVLASLNDTANTTCVCPLCDSALTTLVQDHLHNCVVAFQAVLLVHLTQDGRVLGRHHVGGHQPGNVRCFQAHVGTPGKGSSEDPSPTTRQQKAETWQGQQSQNQGQGSQAQPASGRVRTRPQCFSF